MANHPPRPDRDRPRVDDFFYERPDEDADQDTPRHPDGDPQPERGPEASWGPETERGSQSERGAEAHADADTGPGPAGPAEGGSDGDSNEDADGDSDGDGDVDGDGGSDEDGDSDGRDRARVSATRRRATAGRWARALAVVGVAAALVYGAASDQVAGLDLAAALDRTTPTPAPGGQPAGREGGLAVVTESTLGCLGPDLVGLDDPTVAEPDQTVTVIAGSAPAEVLGDAVDPTGPGELRLSVLPQGPTAESPTREERASVRLSGATWATAGATGSLAPGLSGSQLALSLDEQQRGLSTAACGPAVDEAWFIAGGAEAGRAERLILANPTGNPVTVDVSVLGAEGPVQVVGGRGIVIAPGERQVVLLDALAPGEERPVVRVTTTGGPVLAAVGDRWLEGTLDRGTELTTATAPPGTTLVIPAVPGPRPDTADRSSVRVGVPGTEPAVVQVRALTAEGPVRVAQAVTTVDAGSVADIDVSDLPEGTQAIEVVADTPVVASAQVVRRTDPDGVGELAWIPAVPPSTGLTGVPLTDPGEEPRSLELAVASAEGAHVEVVTVTADVTHVQPVRIPAAGSRALELSGATESIWVRTVEGSAASALVTTTEDDLGTLIAGLVLPEATLTRQVRPVAPWAP